MSRKGLHAGTSSNQIHQILVHDQHIHLNQKTARNKFVHTLSSLQRFPGLMSSFKYGENFPSLGFRCAWDAEALSFSALTGLLPFLWPFPFFSPFSLDWACSFESFVLLAVPGAVDHLDSPRVSMYPLSYISIKKKWNILQIQSGWLLNSFTKWGERLASVSKPDDLSSSMFAI